MKKGVDSLVPQLFAISHDFQRKTDSIDPQHGSRAANRLKTNKSLCDALTEEQLRNLIYACQTHTGGKKAPNLVIGICWDADRLDIGRVGIMPEAKYMTSKTAKKIATSFDAEDELWAYRRRLPSIRECLRGIIS